MKKIKRPIHRLTLEEYTGVIKLPEDTDIIDYSSFLDKELLDKEKYRIVFDACKFEKTTFNNNTFLRSEFIDCKFTNCDLSNNTFTNCTFIRCEFVNCKIIGSHFIESYLDNVLISNSIAEYIDIANSKLKIVSIKETTLEESNWFENEIDGIEFRQNNLTKATFFKTPMKDLDISTCEIEKLRIDHISIKGLIIASWQAEAFCHLLGIQVK